MTMRTHATRLKNDACMFAYALLIAAAVLFFCTKSSPGYPINDWCDANIYLTIGKGMTRGQVVYRDLYDHKGPLLYALHALCALISFKDFFGVYVMEALLAAAFLFFSFKTMRLYDVRRAAWVLLPLLAFAVYSAYSFSEGDSAEELCMPLVAASLYHVLKHMRSGERRMSARGLMLEGALAGCVFWIKFTIIGMHAGLLLCLLLCPLVRCDWRGALRTLGWLVVGFVLSTAPWLVYFGLNGALLPWLKTYLYDNLFLYAPEPISFVTRIKTILIYVFEWVIYNLRYTLPLFLGLFWFLFSRKRSVWERWAVWLAAGLGVFAVFVGLKSYPYYGQAMAPLAALGAVPIGLALEKAFDGLGGRRGLTAGLCAASLVISVGLCPFMARNMVAGDGVRFGQPREETMQYQLAAYINQHPGATLLNYGFMDAGFYTAAAITPNMKYFQENNVPLREMRDEQTRYINEALCDFVVTRGTGPASLEENYDLIAAAQTPGFWYTHVYLYQRKP